MTGATRGTALVGDPPSRSGARDRWLVRRHARPEAATALYCFPHAGGSPGEYVRWSDDLPGVQVWGVQAPGRGARAAEQPFRAMRPLVAAFLDAVDLRPPFTLFGHSLGGLVAVEVARGLRDRARPGPERVVVSATPPPPYPPRATLLHRLPDDELVDEIGRRFGGLPPELLRDPWFRRKVADAHRADLGIFENHGEADVEPLACPITAVVGDGERDRLDMAGWGRHTTAGVDLHVLPGGHFYLREERAALLRILNARLTDPTTLMGA